ncbi:MULTISPECIES: class I SAM-dependent DNA methyltransferase [Bacillaceae]|uniref:Class I SAM-dependent methyltransferase n=1 Tax=Evansella alkalicola TaxID=745819 RepID=A0ABS6JVV9_9BACI|nr:MULTISPECIES: class I SAM-dependent methyltransferase [Bacillaceae]MBU9722530.1 class I SAM-dependent methyltransferase [Bacillus alkalicola]
MNEYHFASIYDVLMEDVPYEDWLTFASTHLKHKGKILDIGCGTASITLLLSEAGYEVSGVDISQEMLTVAEEKVRLSNKNISLYCQDMRKLEGFNDFDGVTIFCDGLNYLPDSEAVKQTFRNVFNALKPGGIFLFDVHSPYKMTNIFNDQLYGEDRTDISYLWFCNPGDKPLSVEHALTFFIRRQDGTYDRLDEEHFQRTFSPEDYKEWLSDVGFIDIEVTSDFGREKENEISDRYFLKAVKK